MQFTAPAVGRSVHYVCDDGHHRAAVVSYIGSQAISTMSGHTVELHVFMPSAEKPVQCMSDVKHDEKCGIGTWHWPEQV